MLSAFPEDIHVHEGHCSGTVGTRFFWPKGLMTPT
jgi:hypothetical protein